MTMLDEGISQRLKLLFFLHLFAFFLQDLQVQDHAEWKRKMLSCMK